MDLGLTGETAIVTGGGTGLGFAIAEELLGEGVRVAIVGRRREVLETAAARLSGSGEVAPFPCDARDPRAVREMVDHVAARLGEALILVNNAGATMPVTFDDLDEAMWRAVYEGKFFPHLWCIRACVPAMRRRRWGRIVNVAGIFGHEPTATNVAQGVNLAALANLTRSLSRTLGPDNVLVSTVVPGPFNTERQAATTERQAMLRGTTADQVREERLRHVALRRMGKPRELAAVVAFLASRRASYVTGSTVWIDGGERRGI